MRRTFSTLVVMAVAAVAAFGQLEVDQGSVTARSQAENGKAVCQVCSETNCRGHDQSVGSSDKNCSTCGATDCPGHVKVSEVSDRVTAREKKTLEVMADKVNDPRLPVQTRERLASGLESYVDDLTKKYGSLAAKIEKLSDRVSKLEKDMSKLRTDVSELRTDVTKVKKRQEDQAAVIRDTAQTAKDVRTATDNLQGFVYSEEIGNMALAVKQSDQELVLLGYMSPEEYRAKYNIAPPPTETTQTDGKGPTESGPNWFEQNWYWLQWVVFGLAALIVIGLLWYGFGGTVRNWLNSPRVTNFWPAEGPVAGGTTLNINGRGFNSSKPAEVKIDGNPATDIVVVNDRKITCKTPPGVLPGKVNVIVKHNGIDETFDDGFEYK